MGQLLLGAAPVFFSEVFCVALKDKILARLSSGGKYISGEELAKEYGVSRAAVWKSVRALKESGVSANNVFIPSEREKFVDALGESVDYLLAGYVETRELDGEESGGKEKMKRVYKLELVELETSKKCEFVADL